MNWELTIGFKWPHEGFTIGYDFVSSDEETEFNSILIFLGCFTIIFDFEQMSEKKGLLVKMVYDFETAANLEVFLPKLDGWYRVTSREFRSFNGKRRINNEPYNGPVYLYQSNKRANKSKYPQHKFAGYNYDAKLTESEKFARGQLATTNIVRIFTG